MDVLAGSADVEVNQTNDRTKSVESSRGLDAFRSQRSLSASVARARSLPITVH